MVRCSICLLYGAPQKMRCTNTAGVWTRSGSSWPTGTSSSTSAMQIFAAVAIIGLKVRAAGAAALGQRALRVELDLELAFEVELGEGLVLADVRTDHLLDLAVLEQQPEPRAIDAGVVADADQVLDA